MEKNLNFKQQNNRLSLRSYLIPQTNFTSQWQFTTSDYHPENIRTIPWKYHIFTVLVVATEKEILMALDNNDIIEKMAEDSYCAANLFTSLLTVI